MKAAKEYFDLSIEELQIIAAWAADCAERSVSIYEGSVSEDLRPRLAIDGARDFSASGKRTNKLRKLAMDANRASLETVDAAAYSALAIELSKGGDREIGNGELERAIASASGKLARLAGKMAEQRAGKKRIDELFHLLDRGLRMRSDFAEST